MQPRNLLDVYLPYRHWFNNGPVPVLVFITGGAYIIGYKAWGALLARRLSEMGVLVVCLDYRNFPQVRNKIPSANP
jgi:prenylcysteine alpha-carboxyl methylesterase